MAVPRITTLTEVWAESAVSALHPGDGFVTLRCLDEDGNSMVGQFTPELARKVALDILEAEVAGESDAALLYALGKVFEDEDQAMAMTGVLFEMMQQFRDSK
jgi:hypothetical protein